MSESVDRMWDQFDAGSWKGSELEKFATRAEEATDSFVNAVNRYIAADAMYQRVRGAAYAQYRLEGSTSAAAEREADAVAIEELIDRRAAENYMEGQKALMRTRLAVLNALQTHQRAVDRQT